jgi:MFS family permease
MLSLFYFYLLNKLNTFYADYDEQVDRVGRKPLLILGYILMGFGHLFIVLSHFLHSFLSDNEYYLSLPGFEN